ncbi:MAG: ABC transporter ATP-binding protein [Calditrichia bacterium]
MKPNSENNNIITVRNLQRRFPVEKSFFRKSKSYVHAVNSVNLNLPEGKTIGLVGESGCGKTTIGRLITTLDEPDGGEILFKGENVVQMAENDRLAYSKKVQIIFQNPYASLNPRQRIYQIFREVLKVHHLANRGTIEDEIDRLLNTVGISPEYRYHYPFEFSGGQRQRLCIARALAVQPEVVVCDEPVSALDVSVQSQILKLLKSLQEQFGLTYLFISHDLSVVYHICDYVYIMYLGQIMEEGQVEEIFHQPKHPYTKALLNAVPVPDPENKRKRVILGGDVPNPVNPPSGCPFHTRCPQRMDICDKQRPAFISFSETHRALCWLYEDNRAAAEGGK